MLEKLQKLYVAAMLGDVRSPLPHLFGPPGCGKSTVVDQLAMSVGKKRHVVNVSRISPLEIEGVQMPHTLDGEEMKLKLLTATFWTQLQEGDILLLDEFLRAFPEVYNGMLDILTSREVGGWELPKVFIIAASNSTVAYDKALSDRLLHLPVEDPRNKKPARKRLGQLIVDGLGLMPEMVDSVEMETLLLEEVCPMFDVLDQIKNGGASHGGAPTDKGHSVRNLIGQARLREVQSIHLQDLLDTNNLRAIQQKKWQYVLLTDAKKAQSVYVTNAVQLKGNPKLSKIQATNLELNLQLIELEDIRKQKGTEDDDSTDDIFSD